MAIGKTTTVIQQVVAATAIARGATILVVRRAADDEFLPGVWELPGGKKEPGESTVAAAMREAAEETGLQVDIAAPCHVFDYSVSEDTLVRETVQVTFVAHPSTDTVVLSREHTEFAWIDERQLERCDVTPETRAAVVAAFRTID
jgi:8-oxo-dGTP diphosphatase